MSAFQIYMCFVAGMAAAAFAEMLYRRLVEGRRQRKIEREIATDIRAARLDLEATRRVR